MSRMGRVDGTSGCGDGPETCPDCGSNDIEEDSSISVLCCRECGCVIEESFVRPENGLPGGVHVALEDDGRVAARWTKGSRATTPFEASVVLRERATQRKFSRIAEELRCTGATAAHAKKYFLRMLGSTRGEGLWIDRLAGACCYLAASQEGRAMTLVDVSCALQEPLRKVAAAYRGALAALGLSHPGRSPRALVMRAIGQTERAGWRADDGKPLADLRHHILSDAMFLADIADRGSLWDGRSPFPVACACHLLSARHWGCSAATPAAAAKLFPVAAGTLAMRERELLARLGDVAASLPWLAHASRGEPLVHLRSIRRAVELEWALHGEADARREPEAEMGDPQSDERLSQRERESVGEERVVGERNGEEKKREERNGAERDGEERNGEAATTSGRSAPATDGARPRGSQRRRSRSRSPSRSPTGGDLGDRGPAPATRLLRCFPHASAPGPAPEGERGSVLGGRDWAPPLVERREAKRRDAVALVGEEASRLEVATAPVLWGRGEEGKEGVRSEVDRVGGAPRAEKRRREERERRVAVRRMLLDGWSKGDVVEALLRRGGIGVGGAYGQVMYGAH